MDNMNLQCKGCQYEFAEGNTPAISNCVCCNRLVDANHDYYKKRKEKNGSNKDKLKK